MVRSPEEQIPYSDKTSNSVSAPPNVKMGSAWCRAVNFYFPVEVKVIFRAEELIGKRSQAELVRPEAKPCIIRLQYRAGPRR